MVVEQSSGESITTRVGTRGFLMNIGFIGLGNMGLPVARHLLQAGHKLTVYNRTRARADQLKQLNPVVADSPGAAARGAEVLVTMVADDPALEAVLLGEQGALAALPRGAIHVSMSTISPGLSRRLAERHRAAGHTYVAAPVFGRPEAADGEAVDRGDGARRGDRALPPVARRDGSGHGSGGRGGRPGPREQARPPPSPRPSARGGWGSVRGHPRR